MLKDKLKIYAYLDNTGVGLYRIYSPLSWLKKLDLAEVKTSDFRWGEEGEQLQFPSLDELHTAGLWADIIVFERHDMPKEIATFCGLGEHFNIPVVLDTDDNVRAVRPYNPGYRGYHPNSEATLWSYKVMEKVNAVTVSTDNLKEVHKDEHKHIYVLPNSMDFQIRDNLPAEPHEGKIHIGWLGSAAHYENLKIIEQAVVDILKKYPQVVFHSMAMYSQSVWKDLPAELRDRFKLINWSVLKEWPKNLAKLGLDIGLAPLADNLFNRAKSNLRWMEYAMNKTAVVVSPVEAYKNVKHEKTGLVAKEKNEWFNAMDRLVQDAELRRKLGESAYREVKEKYNIEKNCSMWLGAYKDIVKRYIKQKGAKTNFLMTSDQYARYRDFSIKEILTK